MEHGSIAQEQYAIGTALDRPNPFFSNWTGPFGVPPFGRIAPEHFRDAFERAFAEHDAEIAAIAAEAAEPTFANTIEALERAGRPLGRVSDVFGVLAGAHTNEALLEIEREISPAPRPPLERHPAQRAAVPAHRCALARPRPARRSTPSRRACWNATT